MRLPRLECLKSIVAALTLMSVAVCGLEIGLRVYEGCGGSVTAASAPHEPITEPSPLVHHMLRPFRTVERAHPDTSALVTLSTNSLGLRGDEPAVPKPTGTYRVLCLGDETVLAAEVEAPHTFSARLEALLQTRTPLKVEVVNAGVPGYCPLLSYLQVRHRLVALQPDLIILNVAMSDVADDRRYRRHTRMIDGVPLACPHPDLQVSDSPYLLADQFILLRWAQCRAAELSPEDLPEDRSDIDAPTGTYAWLRDDPPDWTPHIEQALSPIGQLQELADGVYARFFVSVVPAPWQVSPAASSGPGIRSAAGVPDGAVYRSRRPFELIGGHLAARRILFCDPSSSFGRVQRPEWLYLQNASALSQHGHELYARELANFILRHIPGVWNAPPSNPAPLLRHAEAVPP